MGRYGWQRVIAEKYDGANIVSDIELPLLRPSDPIIDSIIGTEILPVTRHHDYDKKYQAGRRFLVCGSDYEGSPLVAFEDTEFDKPLPLVTENYRGIYRRDSLMFVICNTAARYFAIEASALRYFKEKGSSVLFSYLYYTSEGLIFTHPLEWSFKIAGDRYIPAESNPDLEEIAAR